MIIETVISRARAALSGAAGKDSAARALKAFEQRKLVTRNADSEFQASSSSWDRLADRLAEVGGSWRFILGFLAWLAVWITANALLLPHADRIDPYPFVFLNLILSMVAAVQAPIILMSQNRQSDRDRLAAQQDFEVNLKAELEIMALHEKLDALQAQHALLLEAIQAQGKPG